MEGSAVQFTDVYEVDCKSNLVNPVRGANKEAFKGTLLPPPPSDKYVKLLGKVKDGADI